MSSLIITAPTPDEAEDDITSSAFWPVIKPAEIRAEQRIDNTITAPRLKSALIESIAATNNSLAGWLTTQQVLNGYATLTAVPAEAINDTSILVHRYRRAVGCLAKALLLERYRDLDSTAKGDKKSDHLADPIDDHRRDHHHAIADITGRSRCTVELI